MPEGRRNRSREPRKGAPVIILLAAFIAVCAAVGYFIFAPSAKTDTETVIDKSSPAERAVAPSPVKSPHDIPPPVAVVKPDTSGNLYPKADDTFRNESSSANVKHGAARLAIIVDDMGSSMTEARSLEAIGVPLTFAIIPGLRSYKEVAFFAGSKGIEIMIHMPMQSQGWPERRLEANGLLVSMENSELKERVAGFIRDVPGAVGANNHMGSEFTESEEKMRSVLETLKNSRLFFVDSVTSNRSAGLRIAREMGIKSARRQVFLDNEKSRGYILGQLAQAVKVAKKTGSAIAICHPYPETIAALTAALPGLAGEGITLVPVSRLVSR